MTIALSLIVGWLIGSFAVAFAYSALRARQKARWVRQNREFRARLWIEVGLAELESYANRKKESL